MAMKKKVIGAVLAAVLSVSMLAGCGGQKAPANESGQAAPSAAEGEATEETTQATLILYGEASERMTQFMQNEFRQKVLDEINVDVTVQYLPWTEYAGGKTELMLSTGEKFVTYTDTAFMQKCISKGYYADLTDAAEKYAGDLKKNCGGDEAFRTWTVDGKLYALPFGNKPNAGENFVVLARQDILEEVGMSELASVEDVEKFYALAKEKYPEAVGFCACDLNILNAAIPSEVNVYRPNAFIYTDGNKPEDSTVWSYYESEEYKQACEIVRRWNQMGIIPSYELSNPSQSATEFNNGLCLMRGGANERVFEFGDIVRKAVPDAILKNYYLGDKTKKPMMTRGSYCTAFAVSANVEGKELEGYVKLINLLQSSQEMVDFMVYGVEGTDYTLNDDGTINYINTDTLFDTWLPANVNFKRYPSYATDDMVKDYENWDDGCISQKDIGFSFDMTPVSAEYAQLQAVESEYIAPISAGFVDYDSAIDEAVKKLKEAGIDKFVEEYQRQFNEFMESRG